MGCCEAEINQKLLTNNNITLVASVVLIDQDGRILLATRPDGKEMSGYWEFPGGKIENGESAQATLVRELEEELGVHTCAGCFLPLTFASHPYEKFHLLMPIFACRHWEGIPMAKEGQTLKWVAKSELTNYPMPEANKAIISMIKQLI